MKRTQVYGVIFVLLGWALARVEAQHLSWRNFTINDGLPSNGVYAMIQDSRGFMWIGTSHGICKFNGYEFIRPVDTSGTAYSSTMDVLEDKHGRIWFNRLDGKLWFIENDTIRAWHLNHLLDSLPSKTVFTYRFAVAADRTVWLATWNEGLIRISPEGRLDRVITADRWSFILTNVEGNILGSRYAHGKDDEALRESSGQTHEVFRYENDQLIPLGRFPIDYNAVSQNGLWFWPLKQGQIAGCILKTYYVLGNDRIQWYGQKSALAKGILPLPDGSILAAMSGDADQGLYLYHSLQDFQSEKFDNLLPQKSISRVVLDREGGWWAASNKSGLFYCKNPEIMVYDRSAGLPADEVMNLSSNGSDKVFAGLRQLDIAELDHSGTKPPTLLPKSPVNEMYTLRYDSTTGRLWAGNNLHYFERNRWWKVQSIDSHQPNAQLPAKRITVDTTRNIWWICSGSDIYQMDPRSSTGGAIPIDTFQGMRTFSVSVDKTGMLWVTGKAGLQWWNNGKIQPPVFHHPALKQNPLMVEQLPDIVGGGQVISLIGGGLLIRDSSGRCTHLNTRDGLSTDIILGLSVRSDGTIFGMSNSGLNILTPQSGGRWSIEVVSVKHGLPSNQVNDVLLLDNETWMATDGGIVVFRGKPAPAPMPEPLLEKFVVNNRSINFQQDLQLDYWENNISLRFFALHFRSGGNIPYRYRLSGADTTYTYSYTREVNFANLPPGSYDFEVQAQNEDGQWSSTAHWHFGISPPWYATWWCRSLVLLGIAAGAFWFYRRRLNILLENAKQGEKLRELEMAALRAQMNPHFIFNCLQAIQAFVAKNDTTAASTYLARFAKLIRLALHSSVDGQHSLREELEMLENYLYLEQLRFDQKFSFEVAAAPELALDEISLPPLLVQPFVENAVIHGVQSQSEAGKVRVYIDKVGAELIIQVEDNGKGIKPAPERGAHKSVGMLLTNKRLELLHPHSKPVDIQHLVDDSGQTTGTRITLTIALGQ